MLQREDVRRPAQVNACFEGGSSRQGEIVAALREVGLDENQITVIDRPEQDETKIATEEPSFLERIKRIFGGGDDDAEEHKRYDLLILAHLGDNEALAGPVQEVFQRFNASRVNFYPMAEADLRVLGGTNAESGTQLTAPTTTGTRGTATAAGTTATSSGDARVEPGELPTDVVTTTTVYPSGRTEERTEPAQEVVYRGETNVVVEDATRQPERTAATERKNTGA